MSQFEKELREELTIRKAKYRVKNSAGKYEVVYLETSADQVEQTSDRVFVTPEEKSQITSNKEAIAAETQAREAAVNAINGKIDVINGNEETTGSISKALKDAKAYTDEKVLEINGANSALSGRVEAVEQKVEAVDGKISAAKGEAIESAKTYTDGEIGKIDAAYKAADTKVLEDAKADAQAKVQEAKTTLQSNIDTLAGRVSTNEFEISKLKDAVSNKNSNTIVVETEDEIATENPNPKVGDLAYVISTKRAYIFKGVSAIVVKSVPQGWVVFDEITSELDLVNYLKKSEADTTYRKLADKMAEADLATELVSKIDSKLDGTQVDSKISAAVNTVNEKVVANTAAITQEVADRKSEITRVEGALNSAKTELNSSISSVNSKVDTVKSDLTSSLTEKETALKAEDTRLNNRINKFVPVVAEEEPTETEEGHVWLQLV